jgi:hypothetical protein
VGGLDTQRRIGTGRTAATCAEREGLRNREPEDDALHGQ